VHSSFIFYILAFILFSLSAIMSGSYLVLTEFVLAFLFHSISIGRIVMILKNKFKTHRETSLYFMALLINWLIVALLLLPYEGNGIAIWRPQTGRDPSFLFNSFIYIYFFPDLLYNGQLLYFIAMPAHIFLAMIPVSVFFVTADRICIIHFGASYGPKARTTLKWSYFCMLIICLGVNIAGFLSALPVPTKTS
jgi:hypothetical protein